MLHDAGRWVPEIANFLHVALVTLARRGASVDDKLKNAKAFGQPLPMALFDIELQEEEVSDRLTDIQHPMDLVLQQDGKNRLGFCLKATLKTLQAFATMYTSKEQPVGHSAMSRSADALSDDDGPQWKDIYVSLPSDMGWIWIEAFDPLIDLLDVLTTTSAKEVATETLGRLKEQRQHIVEARQKRSRQLGLSENQRAPLQWQKKKAEALRGYLPKFREQGFNPDRKYDPNPERAEKHKLAAQHRSEMKGALRELRKDASFLAQERYKSRKAVDSAYQKKIKRVYGMLGQEQGEANQLEREKKRGKK